MNLRQHLGLRNFSIQNFAGWVTRFRSLENSDYFWHALRSNPEFESAVRHSREFYAAAKPFSLPSKPLASVQRDPELTSFVEVGIARGELPLIFLAMHHGFYWHRELLCSPNVEMALLDLRRLLYDLLLPSTSPSARVTEYYRDENEQLGRRDVVPRGKYSTMLQLSSRDEDERVAIFSEIFLSNEDGDDESRQKLSHCLAQEFSLRQRFVVLTLRYFLRLTRAHDLTLNRAEAEAVIASVFRVLLRNNADTCQREPLMKEAKKSSTSSKHIVPSFRCLTIFTWLQEVYLYAYNLFGKALNLTRHFPRPRELFEGSSYVTLFMSAAATDEIREEMVECLSVHRSVIDAILRNIEF